MSKVKWKGGTLLAPVPPVLVTCGTQEKPNVFTVAWTGIINSDPPKTYVSVRPSRYSYGLIRETGTFVINLPTVDLVRSVDYCGVHSGRDKDKLMLCNLTAEKASEVETPLLAQCPLALECRVTEVMPLGSHDMFLADIVAVDVDENLLDASGKLCLDKAKLLAYAHGTYFGLGKRLGSFGFSVRKKRKNRDGKK